MKYAVLEKYCIPGIQPKVAYLHVVWIDLALRNQQGFRSQVASPRHQRHATTAPVKIGQTVTDLDPDPGQALMSQVSGNSDITVPAASE